MVISRFLIIVLLTIVLMANRCYTAADIATRITVENKTSMYLYCVPSYSYPDTSLSFTNKEKIAYNSGLFERAPNTAGKIGTLSLCEDNEWKRVVASDTLILFIFKKDIVDNTDWSTIESQNLVYKKYYLTYQDLTGNNCTVVVN